MPGFLVNKVLTPYMFAAMTRLEKGEDKEKIDEAARAFGMLRSFSPPLGIERYRAMIENDLLSHATELVNDFEEPIFGILPALRTLKTQLYESGAAWAAMSGSGSTIVGAFRKAEDRDAALEHFKNVRAVVAETL